MPPVKDDIEKRLDHVPSGAGDGMWEWEFATHEVKVARRWLAALGYGPDEDVTTREQWLGLVHPDDLPRALKGIERHLDGGVPFSVELRIREKSGAWRWALSRAYVERDAEARPLRMRGWLTDIEHVKAREAQARHDEARWQALSELVPVGIFETDAAGLCVFVNRGWSELTGMAFDDARGEGWIDALHPDDLPLVRREWGSLVRGDKPFEAEYRFRRPNGEVRWVRGSATALRGAGGEVTGFAGAVTDITELRESKAFIEQVMSMSPNMIYVVDLENMRYLYLNQATETMTGYTVEQVRDFGISQPPPFIHPADIARTVALNEKASVADDDTITDKRLRFIKPDGTITEVHDRNRVFSRKPDGSVRHVLGVAADVTAVARAEKDAEMQRAIAVSASKMATLGEMAAGIAHEINNPLAIIKMSADRLGRHVRGAPPPTADEVAQLASRIGDTAGRIARIVSGLRQFARDGEHDPFAPADLRKVIAETLSFCAERVKHHGVRLTTPEPGPPVMANCRAVQISQVLLNLISNAFDAVEALPDPGSRWIAIELVSSPEYLELAVRDSGAGVPEAVRDKIMQPFFTTKEVGKGTGLGLSISAGIATTHGGSLKLDPECRETRFVLRLPRKSFQA